MINASFWNVVSDFYFAAQTAMSCAGGPVGRFGGICHGALRDGGEI